MDQFHKTQKKSFEELESNNPTSGINTKKLRNGTMPEPVTPIGCKNMQPAMRKSLSRFSFFIPRKHREDMVGDLFEDVDEMPQPPPTLAPPHAPPFTAGLPAPRGYPVHRAHQTTPLFTRPTYFSNPRLKQPPTNPRASPRSAVYAADILFQPPPTKQPRLPTPRRLRRGYGTGTAGLSCFPRLFCHPPVTFVRTWGRRIHCRKQKIENNFFCLHRRQLR